jgi:hypothetical protein
MIRAQANQVGCPTIHHPEARWRNLRLDMSDISDV